MRKTVILLIACVCFAMSANAQRNSGRLSLGVGVLYKNGLDMTIAYEHEMNYRHVWEFFANGYLQWTECASCDHVCPESFWRNYRTYGFGVAYKPVSYTHLMYTSLQAQADVAHSGTSDPNLIEATMEQAGVDEVTNMEKDASKLWFTSLTSGIVVGIDKIIMLVALVVFRIGWWATIYCQQILLGMLTVFGPIQWAFSLLPKWEGAWAKWLTRYLTVHFYGAMLYFVGFYVLLLFDVVLCIQVENLTAITASEQTMAAYLQNSFFSAGYLMAASIVALKCLNLVPDLAAWMIPEGDTAFSTRNFGEGVAQQAKMTATGAVGGIMR